MKTLGERLKFRREQLGLSQPEVAKRVKLLLHDGETFSQQAYQQLESGKARKSTYLSEICQVLADLDIKWARDGIGPAPLPPGKERMAESGSKGLCVAEYDLRAGASYGGGYAIIDDDGHEQKKADWFFPDGWLRGEMRLTATFTDIIAVDGPSMLPDLAPGDRVLIDRSSRDPKQDAIFAIRDGDSVIIKHIQLLRNTDPPRLVCRSSNPKYEPFELILDGEQVDIIGRVAGRISKM
jgi:transcriptional regulator with XRE-family HTH domain